MKFLHAIAFSFAAALGLMTFGAEAATLYVSEFANGVSTIASQEAQIYPQPAITDQTVAITGASAQSSAFNAKTKAVMVECDTDCSVVIGSNPTATTSNFLMGDGLPYFFAVQPGQKIAVIANTSGGMGSDVNIVAIGGTAVTPGVLPTGGFEFNASVIPTVQNSSYTAGQSLGGLQTVSVGSTNSLTGILTNIEYASKGGSTSAVVVYVWSKNPSGTTCTDKTNFVVSATDNAALVLSPLLITPALVVSGQDATTYAGATQLVGNFVNGSTNTNLYVCILANATQTPGSTTDIRLNLGGIKDQP